LVAALAVAAPFVTGLEQHAERPFQQALADDLRTGGAQRYRYALANQIDYLLLRAEQERELRAGQCPGLVDGGLDQDFHGFTRLFHARGYLTDLEFELCRRFYDFIRATLPAPDLVIHLVAPAPVIRDRLAQRERINIASADDISAIDGYLTNWLHAESGIKSIRIDAGLLSPDYHEILPEIIAQIKRL